MATSVLLRSLKRHSGLETYYRSLGGGKAIASSLTQKWPSLARPFSSKPSGSDITGIDLGTTNSCVAVMEGKSSKVYVGCYRSIKPTPPSETMSNEHAM